MNNSNSGFLSEDPKERVNAWRDRLWDALPEILDVDDLVAIDDETGGIAIRRKAATVHVHFGVYSDDFLWAVIYSPLVYLPDEGLPSFYRQLLDFNYLDSNFGTLATDKGIVYLQMTLAIDGLNQYGLHFNLVKLTEEADAFVDHFVKMTGARPVESEVFDQYLDGSKELPEIAIGK